MATVIPDPDQFPGETDRLNLPPQSVQAEQALLGGLMLDGKAWTGSRTASPKPTSTARTIA